VNYFIFTAVKNGYYIYVNATFLRLNIKTSVF